MSPRVTCEGCTHQLCVLPLGLLIAGRLLVNVSGESEFYKDLGQHEGLVLLTPVLFKGQLYFFSKERKEGRK